MISPQIYTLYWEKKPILLYYTVYEWHLWAKMVSLFSFKFLTFGKFNIFMWHHSNQMDSSKFEVSFLCCFVAVGSFIRDSFEEKHEKHSTKYWGESWRFTITTTKSCSLPPCYGGVFSCHRFHRKLKVFLNKITDFVEIFLFHIFHKILSWCSSKTVFLGIFLKYFVVVFFWLELTTTDRCQSTILCD